MMVDHRWLLDPASGQFASLPYADFPFSEGKDKELLNVSLSLQGEHIVIWDEQEFSFGPVNSLLSGPLPLPNPPQSNDDDIGALTPLVQFLFWNSQNQILFYQQRPGIELKARCRIFDPKNQTWRPAENCPEGDFFQITQVDPGPEGWMAIYSEAEGTKAFNLIHYDPWEKQSEPSILSFDLFPMGFIQAQFSLDGTRVDFATSCRLDLGQYHCRNSDETEPWRLYSWNIKEQRLVMRQENLPPNFTPSPTGEQLAWPLPGRICVSNGIKVDSVRCYELPTCPMNESP